MDRTCREKRRAFNLLQALNNAYPYNTKYCLHIKGISDTQESELMGKILMIHRNKHSQLYIKLVPTMQCAVRLRMLDTVTERYTEKRHKGLTQGRYIHGAQ